MRVVTILVPEDEVADVRDALDAEGVDHVETSETTDAGVLVEFPVPTEAVEVVFDRLDDSDVSVDYSVVANAEAATTPRFEDLEDRFVTGTEEERIATDEIRAKARDMNPGRQTYYAMTVLSVVVATVGLLLDAPAIVVGSMVMAPQVGTTLVSSLGLALNDTGMVRDGFRGQVGGLVVAVLAGALFGLGIKHAQFVPPTVNVGTLSQISSRTSPGVLSVVVGICAGGAGAFGLSTDLPVSLVGVAVAAALIPAAGAIGIGIAWGYPAVALGAAVLLVINVLTITVAGAGVFWYLGYRPDGWRPWSLRANLRAGRVTTITVVLVVLVLVAVPTGALVAEQARFENEATRAVQTVLDRPDYQQVELVSTRTEYGSGPLGGPQSLTLTIRYPQERSYPDLPGRIQDQVADRTGRRVRVTVELVPFARTEGG